MVNTEVDNPHTKALRGALERFWGYSDFRPLQREAMTAVMEGRDSVVVLPTGGGKSLCFQAPAVAMGGMALVVSPLIALMKDQVDTLRNCGVPAAYLNSTLSTDERRQVLDSVKSGKLKLLYVAPERLLLDGTLTMLANSNLSLAAIDEAHCISSWGHDFRPEYRGLARLKEVFPDIGVHAYTATATEAVREDIAKQLGLREPEMLVGSFDRPNLTYRVLAASGKLGQIAEVAKRHHGESGIVYCISRKEVEKTAAALEQLGIKAAPYHAGLGDEQRRRTQENFLNDRVEVIVATVAFGMGIDKPDVRFVVHAGMPKSLEAYQQEAGRAGRDGLPAECLLLFSRGDAATWKRIIESPTEEASPEAVAAALRALDGVSSYAGGVVCRHRALVEHFGQSLEGDDCGACDVCLSELDLVDDPLILAQKIISCVARLEQRYGADYTCKVLAGSSEEKITSRGHDRLSTYGLLKDCRTADIRGWIEQLVAQGHLVKAGEYGVLHITPKGLQLLKGEGNPQLLKAASNGASSSATGGSRRDLESWEGVDRGLFEELRKLRGNIAAEASVPAYVVFGDATLRDMARLRPSSLEAFGHTHGVGQQKLRQYGDAFLGAIRSYCEENGVAMDIETGQPSIRRAAPRAAGPNASSLAAFPLFREGASIEQAAKKLGRARSTTVGYLSDYLKHETVTDPSPWVDRPVVMMIESAIEEVGLGGLRPIHERLGGEVDYDAIKIVATCVANRERT
ncbi:DNA helicase RecQ [Botrimarina mediterranea]|uniref:DNA helicase RecQ n=1 Tax=Botrimarina mediterranea TaxID=2528022 RepID=A0A518KDT5_9BACT|nr:DNA helicase RecQ [Botrimarina mediterranea]QDV75954.1 ATP-dependent DNA helicase RecQ [Botrimarina mediterranea]QDV80549.1 ATP-dependent DNA helicase RecQ [Planctomycetes bacterium K2D]